MAGKRNDIELKRADPAGRGRVSHCFCEGVSVTQHPRTRLNERHSIHLDALWHRRVDPRTLLLLVLDAVRVFLVGSSVRLSRTYEVGTDALEANNR